LENDMNTGPRLGCLGVIMLCLGAATAAAQAPEGAAPRNYRCEADAHCTIYCTVDGEKVVQTGSPKVVTITPLARNNYLIELVEQTGHVQIAYLAGTKVMCTLEGFAK
jgi:hypothetical protein